jgi:hypothetical protein
MLIHNLVITGSVSLNGTDVTGITGSNDVSSSFSALSGSFVAVSSSFVAVSQSYSLSSASFSTRVTNNESTASILTTASASFAVVSQSYSEASGSLSTRVTTIESKYATTGSNIFTQNQTICGNLTTTGTITAQTINVQQVTSSVVYSSGSNIFGCSLSNTQQMTGSVGITGSLFVQGPVTSNNIACFTTVCSPTHVGGTFSGTTIYGSTAICGAVICGGATTLTGALSGTSATFSTAVYSTGGFGSGILSLSSWGSSVVAPIIEGLAGNAIANYNGGGTTPEMYIVSNAYYNGTSWVRKQANAVAQLQLSGVNNKITLSGAATGTAGSTFSFSDYLTINASTGAATFSSTSGIGVTIQADWDRSATNNSQLYIRGNSNTNKQLRIGYDTTGNVGYIQALTSGTSTDNLLINPSGGNVGIGTTDTQNFRLAVDGPNVTQGDANTTIRIFDTTSATTNTGGGISFGGYFDGTSSVANTLSYIKGGKENSTAGNFAAYLSFGTRVNNGNPTERMRITSGGNVGIGSTSPSYILDICTSGVTQARFRGSSTDAAIIRLENTTSTQTYGIGAAGSSNLGGAPNNSFYVRDETSNGVRLAIDSGGRVGIGTTAYRQRLEVGGAIRGVSDASNNSAIAVVYGRTFYKVLISSNYDAGAAVRAGEWNLLTNNEGTAITNTCQVYVYNGQAASFSISGGNIVVSGLSAGNTQIAVFTN